MTILSSLDRSSWTWTSHGVQLKDDFVLLTMVTIGVLWVISPALLPISAIHLLVSPRWNISESWGPLLLLNCLYGYSGAWDIDTFWMQWGAISPQILCRWLQWGSRSLLSLESKGQPRLDFQLSFAASYLRSCIGLVGGNIFSAWPETVEKLHSHREINDTPAVMRHPRRAKFPCACQARVMWRKRQ